MKNKDLSRRDFLKWTAVGSGLAVSSVYGFIPKKVYAASPKLMTGVTYYTPSYEGILSVKRDFIQRLEEEAGDRFKVDFYDSGTLMKADEQTSALRTGTIQFMFHTTSYITRSFKILGITGLPSLVQQLYKHGELIKMESPLWKLINDNLAKDDIFMLTAGGGVLEPEYIWSGSKKIASLNDISGKRLRIVSYEATEALKQFGAAGVRIPSSETYLALQRGTVDGAVLNINTTIGRRLYEQLKYCYQLPVTAFTVGLFMSKRRWEQFDTETKSSFWNAARWYDENFCSRVNSVYNKETYWPKIHSAGIESFTPTENEAQLFQEKSEPIWNWWKKEVGETVGQQAIDLVMGAK